MDIESLKPRWLKRSFVGSIQKPDWLGLKVGTRVYFFSVYQVFFAGEIISDDAYKRATKRRVEGSGYPVKYTAPNEPDRFYYCVLLRSSLYTSESEALVAMIYEA